MKWKAEIEGTTPLIMHRFIGIDESKTNKEKPDDQQAEAYAYRNKKGELGIPTANMRTCIIEGFVQSAGRGQKTSTKMEVSPRIQVKSLDEDSMYLTLDTQSYDIDKRSVPSGGGTRSIRDWCIRPILGSWSTWFIVQEDLNVSYEDLMYKLVYSGSDVGVLGNRPNGYGRFKVVSLEETT